MKRPRRTILLILLLLTSLVGISAWLTYREVAQQRLNHSLMAAIHQQHKGSILALLQQGADPNSHDTSPDNRSLWRIWLDRMTGKHRTNNQGPSALIVTLNRWLEEGSEEPPNPEIVQALLEKGANVRATDLEGNTPLLLALTYDKPEEIIVLLLAHGADVNAKNRNGATALGRASNHRNWRTVRLFLEHGADVNGKDGRGSPALDWAVEDNKLEMVDLFLRHGADVLARDAIGATALMYTCDQSNATTLTIIDRLLKQGVWIEDADRDGDTALHRSAGGDGTPVTVRTLLDRGANINCRNNGGNTPLMEAANTGKTHNVRLLLSRGTDTQVKNKAEQTALMLAIQNQHEDIVRLLRKAGVRK